MPHQARAAISMETLALTKISLHRILNGFEGAVKSLPMLSSLRDFLLSVLQVRGAKASPIVKANSIENTLANVVPARVFHYIIHIHMSAAFIPCFDVASCNLLKSTYTLVCCKLTIQLRVIQMIAYSKHYKHDVATNHFCWTLPMNTPWC